MSEQEDPTKPYIANTVADYDKQHKDNVKKAKVKKADKCYRKMHGRFMVVAKENMKSPAGVEYRANRPLTLESLPVWEQEQQDKGKLTWRKM